MRNERSALGGVPRALPFLALLVAGCPRPPRSPSPPTPFATLKFEDVTERAGLRWRHNPCRTGKKFLPETVGGGGGFLDIDRDGDLDIVLVNGAPLPGYKGPVPRHALYKNDGHGTFADATAEAGLAAGEYGIGAATGDFDNDGWTDLFITAVGRTRLWRNDHGRFVNVTARTKTGIEGFTTAAAWIDYDRDGRLDLFVARYVRWSPEIDLPCGPVNARQYCAPHQYTGAPPVLLHQRADGTFEDVSQKAGVLGHPSKTLAIAPYDVNGDGWIDLYLANDTEPDVLLVNQKNGTFVDQALEAGVAVGTDGTPTGSMGVDIATPFHDGRTGIAIGTFAAQQLSLFVAAPDAGGALLFDNRKQESGVAVPTQAMTTFGLVFADVDSDGYPDLLALNGHIDDDQALAAGGQRVTYRQAPSLFQNRRDGTFGEVGAAAGLKTPIVGRGLASGDIDNDGRPDFLAIENGGPARLWRNATAPAGEWLGVELVGTKGVRDASGAMVTLSGKGWSQTRCVTTARSYLSACDPRLLFGLPPGGAEKLVVRWPDGRTTTHPVTAKNRYVRIEKPG